MSPSARPRRLGRAALLLAACLAVPAAPGCDDTSPLEYAFSLDSVELTSSVDESTWVAHVAADFEVVSYYEAGAALDAVRITDLSGALTFTTTRVDFDPAQWPIGAEPYALGGLAHVHVEADAPIPESERASCVTSELSIDVDVVTAAGTATAWALEGGGCL